MERIAIIGLGLIGGSIGLGLKDAGIADMEIAGVARTRGTVQTAKRIGAIDVDCGTAAEAVAGARLVIIASPIITMQNVFAEIAPALREGAIVTDAASTKGRVMRWAREALPGSVHFVGGHPMAGKETVGIDAAEPGLFRDRPWVVCPSVNAPEHAISTVVALAQTLGARPVFMDADEHDSYVAAISHLPLVASAALFSMASKSAAWPELAQLASSGFRDTTRLASGSPEMAHDIMTTNRDNVLHWIDRMQEELSAFRRTIEEGESKALLERFTRPQVERDEYVATGGPKRSENNADLPNFSITDFLFGSKMGDMIRKQDEVIRNAEKRAEGGKR